MKTVFRVLFLALMAMILPAAVFANDDEVTEGTLKIIGKPSASVCPLKHTSVDAKLSGFIGRVTVKQSFHNPLNEPIEAVYIFPLPNRAAVDSMVMKIGDRVIKANIKSREDAKRIYNEAKNAGKRTALLEQERPNIFTQSVANIMPNDKIEITISYVEQLSYCDGVYEFVFPMVVGPRFIPGGSRDFNAPNDDELVPVTKEEKVKLNKEQSGTGWAVDTDRVPDASRITPVVTPPGTRAGHDISLKVSIDSPVAINDINSVLHKVNIAKSKNLNPPYNAIIELKKEDSIPNKDFILKYSVAGKKIEEGFIYHNSGKNGGFFSLVLQPPDRPSANEITPKEMIFVIDTSGSQSGWPLAKAVETMTHCIDNMNADDTFNLLDFSNQTIKLFNQPVPSTAENRKKAKDFLTNKLAGGGTHMLPAVVESLQLKEDPKRLRIVCFMTDGYVGNDMEIIDSIAKNLGNSRLFSFGTGNSVNRYLIDKMAEAGRGEAEFVTLNRSGAEVAEAFQRKIGTPMMTDVSVDWNGMPVSEVFPQNHPDLFSSKPLIFTGRYSKAAKGRITIKGNIAKRPFSKKIEVDFPANEPKNDVLASLWARTKIESLMDKDLTGIQSGNPNADIKRKITQLGLDFNLVTQFTSFVAVEEKVVNKNGKTTTVAVPVELPDGVKYEGIFGGGNVSQDESLKEKGEYLRLYSPMPPRGGVVTKSKMASESYCIAPQASTNRVSGNRNVVAVPQQQRYSSAPPRHYSYDDGSGNAATPGQKYDDTVASIVKGKLDDKTRQMLNISGDRINVYVKVSHISGDLLSQLKKAGLKVDNYSNSKNIVVGSIGIKSIENLASLTDVKKIEFLNQGKQSVSASQPKDAPVISKIDVSFISECFFSLICLPWRLMQD